MGDKKFPGDSLDIFPESLIAARDNVQRLATAKVGSLLVRSIDEDIPSGTPVTAQGINHFVTEVDRCLGHIARAADAQVVPHRWGLLRSRGNQSLALMGIEGFRLGVEVEVVGGEPFSPEKHPDSFEDVYQRTHFAAVQFCVENGWTIMDAAFPGQYMHDPSKQPELTLVDVSPKIVPYSDSFAKLAKDL